MQNSRCSISSWLGRRIRRALPRACNAESLRFKECGHAVELVALKLDLAACDRSSASTIAPRIPRKRGDVCFRKMRSEVGGHDDRLSSPLGFLAAEDNAAPLGCGRSNPLDWRWRR